MFDGESKVLAIDNLIDLKRNVNLIIFLLIMQNVGYLSSLSNVGEGNGLRIY